MEQRQGARRRAWRSARREAQVGEDLDNYLGINDGGDHLQVPATARAAFDVDSEHALVAKHAQLIRAGAEATGLWAR